MATHDAGKIGDKPEDRRTNTRDPNSTAVIAESGNKDKDGNRTTVAGSTYLTTCIDGKWYVCKTRGEPVDMNQPFTTESDAVAEAQRMNAGSGNDDKSNIVKNLPPEAIAERDRQQQEQQQQ